MQNTPRFQPRRGAGACSRGLAASLCLLALAGMVACAASSRATTQPPPAPAQAAPAKAAPGPTEPLLEQAFGLLHGSRYEPAEEAFLRALQAPADRAQAQLGLAELYLVTGRYGQAITATQAARPATNERAALLQARAYRRQGDLASALNALKPHLDRPRAYGAQLLAGSLLIEKGKRTEGEALLMRLIDAYNGDRITSQDGLALSQVARAAQLLRSPEDANDAFNQAEQVLVAHIPTLLWRAELFLDNYDDDHAEQVLQEVLDQAPNHPDALTLMAQVKLSQALDFDEAKRLIERAHRSNPNHAHSYFVLAGMALRDMLLDDAAKLTAQGLRVNPHDLELLSIDAAVEFLADNTRAFDTKRRRVMAHNAQYSRFYEIVGEFAEWEHRYTEIISLMQEAISVDDDAAKAHATLGLNLIRNGDEQAGLRSLRRAYAKDPFNVRVFNTLELYERVIAKDYETVEGPRFRLRYPKLERDLLSRYVPALLDRAWDNMVQAYRFTPTTPVGIELYSSREHFAVRTSGLPHTAIQGVCFGRTLAAMTPLTEDFNQPMTLWHELAHVFHIQLSNNRVPRWFTEGLAEYETLVHRPEWKRERDAELYLAQRDGRLPRLGAMNEAFTHVEDMLDVTVAYYASTQIVRMLAERYGRDRLREMLLLWGKGHSTQAVMEQALNATPEALDRQFREYLDERLARFKTQFVPDARIGNPQRVQQRAAAEPNDPDAQAALALLALQSGDNKTARVAIDRTLQLNPDHAQGLWLQGRWALRRNKLHLAQNAARKLVALGRDGHDTQLLLAKSLDLKQQPVEVQRALERAHRFDPEQAEPLHGLLLVARQRQDRALEEQTLRQLVELEEHDGASSVALLKLLRESGRAKESVELGRTAIWADLEGAQAHLAYGAALEQSGNPTAAEFELVSATLCPADLPTRSSAYRELAAFYERRGQATQAKRTRARLKELAPEVSDR